MRIKFLSREAQKLYQLYQKALFAVLVMVWICIGIPSIWGLRSDFARLIDYFTWTSLRFTLFYKPQWPTIGLFFCLITTLYVLLSQSRYELFGLMKAERILLEKAVIQIRRLPPKHPLRQWVSESNQLTKGQ
jgi:hypothetical protein